ncbi:GOLPH3/VPS74 family protein [Pseudosporangium ferrugineum]|uniref:Golgi phosphoprotein 3 GPP34 n=1 Tax=Pseudosporangium ferrugineum TaxID=439699 RepID=A0A2T0SB80_9ACTN|nr:GPP34 family phosphoprotein [Pseudosporangium ferrugineum]PRY30583.1 Golgi phosphoprotein 3 GPP34 [Pseudosporangium ferrugineum]
MAVPTSLAQRVFLLAHDPAKGRVRTGTHLGSMLRAAALADLYLAGNLTDVRGRAAVEGRYSGGDPVLDGLLAEIAGARPRTWQSWVGRGHRATIAAVRRQLADDGWVRLEPRRVLGLFPVTRVTIRDPRVRKELLARVRTALKEPTGRVDPQDAALVAIVAAGELTLVLDRRARRASERRIAQLTEVSGPAGPALHRVVQAANSSAAG